MRPLGPPPGPAPKRQSRTKSATPEVRGGQQAEPRQAGVTGVVAQPHPLTTTTTGDVTATATPPTTGGQQAESATRAPLAKSVWELTAEEIGAAAAVAKAIANLYAATYFAKATSMC